MQCDAAADADTSLNSPPLGWTIWYGTRLEGWMRRIPRAEGEGGEIGDDVHFRVVKHL